ncbi:hypothetical protein AALP_AA4G017200 [Arabis alpina]|uniref:Uncharacterized protein n=1 Tax=Arabis alpina TaxID=50452 RepID=A0A087H0J0_ARAAL|nr:hypothetical protein AALP_AA4G017200 [Arabis alpina]
MRPLATGAAPFTVFTRSLSAPRNLRELVPFRRSHQFAIGAELSVVIVTRIVVGSTSLRRRLCRGSIVFASALHRRLVKLTVEPRRFLRVGLLGTRQAEKDVGNRDVEVNSQRKCQALPKSARFGNAGQLAEKACSDAASSSWLRPCSKKTDATQVPGVSNKENPVSPSLDNEPIDDVPILADELAADAPGLVVVKAEMEEFNNAVEQRRHDHLASSRRRAPRQSRKKPRVKNAKKLETAKQDARNSLTFLTRRNEQVDELKKQVGQKREFLKTAKALIVDLHEKFTIAKSKFVELKCDPQDKMIFQVQREANLDFVKQLLGLFLDRKVPRLEDELASLTADMEGQLVDKSLENLAAEAGVKDVSGSLMSLENAGGLLQEMRIDSIGLLKNLMISEDGRMSFTGEDEAKVSTTVAEDTEAEKTRIGGEAAKIEEIVVDEDGAEKAVAEKAGLATLVISTEVVKDAEVHP